MCEQLQTVCARVGLVAPHRIREASRQTLLIRNVSKHGGNRIRRWSHCTPAVPAAAVGGIDEVAKEVKEVKKVKEVL